MCALGDRVDRIARKQQARTVEEQRKRDQLKIQFRLDMPEVAAFVDDVRVKFGDDSRVLYAEEGGHRIGTGQGREWGVHD